MAMAGEIPENRGIRFRRSPCSDLRVEVVVADVITLPIAGPTTAIVSSAKTFGTLGIPTIVRRFTISGRLFHSHTPHQLRMGAFRIIECLGRQIKTPKVFLSG